MISSILITGANGQLGSCLRDLAADFQDQYNFYYTDVAELDICDASKIESFVQEHPVDIIINAAAYTAVDRAEDDQEAAYRINRDAVRNLAEVAQRHQLFLVHISTDYVFDGHTNSPYKEEDTPRPCSVYGSSKLAGEEAMRESGCRGAIIRTSWLYSEYGHNFVKTMLKLGRERENLSVVYDQIGAPTYAGDLAKVILDICEQADTIRGVETLHFANEGSISWFEFAKSALEMADVSCSIMPILTSEYPTKAKRPPYSLFNLGKIKNKYGVKVPYWRDSLILTINKLSK